MHLISHIFRRKATVCIKDLKDIWVVYNHFETRMTELHSDFYSNPDIISTDSDEKQREE